MRMVLSSSLSVFLFFLSALPSSALVFEVSNLDDAGAGSLRQAILDANTNPGPDDIVFQDGLTGTITLADGRVGYNGLPDHYWPGGGRYNDRRQ